MAKNRGRRANVEAKKQSQQEAKTKEQFKQRESLDKQPESTSKKKEVLYQVTTKRDTAMLKAFITFTYRVLHPGVTGRLVFFGLLIAAPAIIIKTLWLRILCLVLGGLLILLGFFRQYISLALTKSKDEAYKNGTEFVYNFTLTDAAFYADGKLFSTLSKYKDITGFYYDDDFYYLGTRGKDFFILPKSKFTIGDPKEFEDFIYQRSRKTCRWIPDKLSDRIKLRRAQRTVRFEQDDLK